MLKPSLILLTIPLWLFGCSLHRPQPIEPPAALPGQYLEQADSAEMQLPLKPWWQSFNDPVLNQLMEQLFRSNLNLAQGHAKLRQSEAVMHQARALKYPSLSLDGQAASSSQPGKNADSQGQSAQLSIAAAFELDLFGKLASRRQATNSNYQASLNDLQSLYLSLSAQLADLYYLAIEQRAQLVLTDNTIANRSDSLQRVEDRYRQGLAEAVDLYQARQNLAAARTNRLGFEQALRVAENGLAVLLGEYPKNRIFAQAALIPPAPPQWPNGLPAALLNNRPDIRAAFLRVEARDAEVAAAIAERFPSFSLVGSFGISRSDTTGSLISGDFWSMLTNFSQPLFNAGRLKAEVARNQAVFAEAVSIYQERVLRSFQEVEDALSGNRTAAARIEQLAEQFSATEAAQRLALDRYLFGLTDYLPVLTAQIFHFNTQSQQLAARRQLLSQRISLARALGGSWMADQLKTDHQRLNKQEQRK